jgi:hypothetical protein
MPLAAAADNDARHHGLPWLGITAIAPYVLILFPPPTTHHGRVGRHGSFDASPARL